MVTAKPRSSASTTLSSRSSATRRTKLKCRIRALEVLHMPSRLTRPVSPQGLIRGCTNCHMSALSPQMSPPQVPYTQRAVRHSSLLRFAQNAESLDDTSSPEAELTQPSQILESPKSHVVTYRPRSRTYPWVESEADDDLPAGTTHYCFPVDEFADLTIGQPHTPYIPPKSRISTSLRADAREFTPLTLPSPLRSATSLVSSQSEHQAELPRITPTLISREPPVTPPRRSSLAYQLRSSNGHLNSPMSSVVLPAALPATPSPVRISPSTHTEPPTYHGYGGSSRLVIYNDHLPSTQQPQTPADLARQSMLTDREAAYTAPPGQVGRRRVISQDTSPTTRSRELRTRWTREYERAEIVERERDQRTGPRLWVDGWALDRVGEENS
jgi:hypothetical protein